MAGFSVLTNNQAALALFNLNRTNESLGQVNERLSTGLAVNGASEGASTFIIAQGLRSDAAAFRSIQENLGFGTAILNNTETSLNDADDVLSNLRGLVLDARPESAERSAIQLEIDSELERLESIIDAAGTVGGQNLLAGALEDLGRQFSVVSSVTDNNIQTIDVDYQDLSLGNQGRGLETLNNFSVTEGRAVLDSLDTPDGFAQSDLRLTSRFNGFEGDLILNADLSTVVDATALSGTVQNANAQLGFGAGDIVGDLNITENLNFTFNFTDETGAARSVTLNQGSVDSGTTFTGVTLEEARASLQAADPNANDNFTLGQVIDEGLRLTAQSAADRLTALTQADGELAGLGFDFAVSSQTTGAGANLVPAFELNATREVDAAGALNGFTAEVTAQTQFEAPSLTTNSTANGEFSQLSVNFEQALELGDVVEFEFNDASGVSQVVQLQVATGSTTGNTLDASLVTGPNATPEIVAQQVQQALTDRQATEATVATRSTISSQDISTLTDTTLIAEVNLAGDISPNVNTVSTRVDVGSILSGRGIAIADASLDDIAEIIQSQVRGSDLDANGDGQDFISVRNDNGNLVLEDVQGRQIDRFVLTTVREPSAAVFNAAAGDIVFDDANGLEANSSAQFTITVGDGPAQTLRVDNFDAGNTLSFADIATSLQTQVNSNSVLNGLTVTTGADDLSFADAQGRTVRVSVEGAAGASQDIVAASSVIANGLAEATLTIDQGADGQAFTFDLLQDGLLDGADVNSTADVVDFLNARVQSRITELEAAGGANDLAAAEALRGIQFGVDANDAANDIIFVDTRSILNDVDSTFTLRANDPAAVDIQFDGRAGDVISENDINNGALTAFAAGGANATITAAVFDEAANGLAQGNSLGFRISIGDESVTISENAIAGNIAGAAVATELQNQLNAAGGVFQDVVVNFDAANVANGVFSFTGPAGVDLNVALQTTGEGTGTGVALTDIGIGNGAQAIAANTEQLTTATLTVQGRTVDLLGADANLASTARANTAALVADLNTAVANLVTAFDTGTAEEQEIADALRGVEFVANAANTVEVFNAFAELDGFALTLEGDAGGGGTFNGFVATDDFNQGVGVETRTLLGDGPSTPVASTRQDSALVAAGFAVVTEGSEVQVRDLNQADDNTLTRFDLGNTQGGVIDFDALLDRIDTAAAQIDQAQAEIGAAVARVEEQAAFIEQVINNFDTAVGALVDANLAEESARFQALQVQQQLGVQSLSIANGQPQIILSLFQ